MAECDGRVTAHRFISGVGVAVIFPRMSVGEVFAPLAPEMNEIADGLVADHVADSKQQWVESHHLADHDFEIAPSGQFF